MKNIKPKDVVAICVVLIWGAMKYFRIDTVADGALMLVLGYYFVKRGNGQDNGK